MLDLDTLIVDCRRALADGDRVPAMREVLDQVARDPAAVASAVGDPTGGGITTLHHTPDLTILNVVWTPGMTMAPHDHTMLAGLVVYGGREDNDFYRRAGERVESAGGRSLASGDVLLLGDDAIHAVRSHPDRYTGAIHVYAGDFFDRVRHVWEAEHGSPVAEPPEVATVFADAERSWRARTEAT